MIGEIGALGCGFYMLGALVFPFLAKILFTRELQRNVFQTY
jgi:hypothetical protein